MPTRHGRHTSKPRSRRRKRRGRNIVWFLVLAMAAGLVSAYALTQSTGTSRADDPRPSSTSTGVSPGAGPAVADSVVKIDVLGDSYTAGSVEGGRGAANWTRLVGTRFTDRGDTVELNVMAQPGSGYIARGNAGLHFREIVTLRLREDADVVLVFGSRNDGVQTDDAMYTAAKSLYADIRDRAPSARIIAVGPAWGEESAPDFIRANNEAMARAASEEDVRYVDAIAAGWFAGDSTGLISEDGIHPTDAGHDYLAGKIFPLLADAMREMRTA
ncbi:SGNH/GDSL hydrolase family protein [Arthrobacter yangruifuii]|uniref:SGNH/GDSL hydrolase family protein n=1 Tax=Arthrobacter yangruifuii TaxID=2606616 RepID=UPI0011B659FD|nr:SGNH/GDSL hydrolase family protein [Arthrobacter yangruifuii]